MQRIKEDFKNESNNNNKQYPHSGREKYYIQGKMGAAKIFIEQVGTLK